MVARVLDAPDRDRLVGSSADIAAADTDNPTGKVQLLLSAATRRVSL